MKKVKNLKFLVLILTVAIAMGTFGTAAPTAVQAQDDSEVTTVWQSDDSPTGYYVTFRYKDPDATRVRLWGEWYFSDLTHSTVSTGLDAMPDEWQDGYFVWTPGAWPAVDMVKDEETGIWSYTIPLPSGTWNYRFYVGGAEGADVMDYTDAVMAWDPNDPPMLVDYEGDDLTESEYLSDIYVPYDAEKQAKSVDRTVETPRDGENGEAFFTEVPTADGVNQSFGVYLPYEFDAEREEPYPVLVLMHGGSGSESDWFNNGIINILDNMIAEGRLEPTVVVTPNYQDPLVGGSWDFALLLDRITDSILPYMVENYNVSEDSNRRAFAGLSMGGATTMHAYFNNTDDFQYYLSLSPALIEGVNPDYTIENLAEKTLFFGYGSYDYVVMSAVYRVTHGSDEVTPLWGWVGFGHIYQYFYDLNAAGISFTNLELHYGHTWTLWRECMSYAFDNVLWQ
jgi:enterochelin esterase-like enzyme